MLNFKPEISRIFLYTRMRLFFKIQLNKRLVSVPISILTLSLKLAWN